jgi:23S rRNA (pseudouridine1915-N3)-methyltransferase
MRLRIIAVGTKAPNWVTTAFAEYSKRMPNEMKLDLTEVAAPRHSKDLQRARIEEGNRTLQKINDDHWVIALDEHGPAVSSVTLADKLADWRLRGSDVAFLVGGADGLADSVRDRANETISLSKLTFPHYMVRVILAESLYRAWTIHTGHPYHRV